MLASIESVDYVVPFEEPTPINLIRAIQPDVLVKGSDYKNKEIAGQEDVNEVVLIDFIDGKSTTGIINKINSLDSH